MKTPIRKSVPHFQDSVPHFQDSVPHFRTECQFPSFDLSGPGWSWSILVGPDWPWLVSGHLGLVLVGIGTPGTPWNALKHLVQSCPEMWDTLDLNWCPTFQDWVLISEFQLFKSWLILVDPGWPWLALVGLRTLGLGPGMRCNTLKHLGTPWNTLFKVVLKCGTLWIWIGVPHFKI